MMAVLRPPNLLAMLPPVRGRMEADAPLAPFTWFRVGGPADVLFRPADAEDLAGFLAAINPGLPVTVIGVGSNLLVRDGGVDGVVIRLGSAFGPIVPGSDGVLTAGAAALDVQVAQAARDAGIAGLEFLRGVPGTIGGALAMNAGAYGADVAERVTRVDLVTRYGARLSLERNNLAMTYRAGHLPHGTIVVAATFQGYADDPEAIGQRMADIQARREVSQPVRAKTGGSTFKNPPGAKAWELIDRAGCRGLVLGDAQVSEQHCNFLINRGAASAADLEALGEMVRRRVQDATGILLEWEIKRIGREGAR